MSIRHIGNGVTVILFLLCVLLSFLIFNQWQGYSEEPLVEVVSQKPEEKPTRATNSRFMSHRGKRIQISQFSEILARPLFTEGRLPPEQPVVEQAQAQQLGTPKLKLEGIVLSPESRVAVVRDLTSNSLIRLSEGMIHTGWRLDKVNNSEVVFIRGVETFNLTLELINKPMAKSSTSRFRLPTKKKPARAR